MSLGAILGGAASGFAQAWLQNSWDRSNAAEAHDWSVEDAAENRRFQERMANTAHQREVADLRAAGLNPILSGTGGAGANTPSGGMPSVSKANAPEVKSFASAMEAKINSAQVNLLKAQEDRENSATSLNRAQERKTKREADILGPKATILDKLNEMVQSGVRSVEKQVKGQSDSEAIKLHNSRVKNPVRMKP